MAMELAVWAARSALMSMGRARELGGHLQTQLALSVQFLTVHPSPCAFPLSVHFLTLQAFS